MSTQPRLCKEIMLEHFGPIVQQVAQVLLTKGRLTLSGIVHFTGLPVRTVRESLVVMIQHNVCFYAEAREGNRQVSYYSIGQDEILMRLRIGRIIYWAGEWFGKEATTILHLIFLNGRLALKDLIQWVKDNESMSNQRLAVYNQKFSQLASKRFITAVMPEDSKARIDRRLEAEAIASGEILLGPSNREKTVIEAQVQDQLQKEDESRQMIGMKRKLVDDYDEESNKRMAFAVEMEVEDDVFFRINFQQFTMHFRNESVIDQATETINRGAGQILRLFLEQSNGSSGDIGKDESKPTSALHVASVLPHDMLIDTGLDTRDDAMPSDTSSASDIVGEYFELLRQCQARFIKRADSKGHSFYVVDFKSIRQHMKRKLFDRILKSKFGNSTCRIARILIEKGKLEEKQANMKYHRVQKLAMLPAKDTREKLALLCTHGICDIQEVPKSADRAPSRTIFLWFVSLEKCYQELLMDIYRSIANVRQRIRHELATRQRLLEKMERKDVSENQDLLSASDKMAIDDLNKKIERLEVSEARLDEMFRNITAHAMTSMLPLANRTLFLRRQCWYSLAKYSRPLRPNVSYLYRSHSTKRIVHSDNVQSTGQGHAGPEFMSKYYQPRKSEIMDFLYSHQQRPVPASISNSVIANCPHCMKVKRNSFAAQIDLEHGNYSCRTCQTKGTWQDYTKAFRKKKGDSFKTFSVSDIRGDRKTARFSRPIPEIETFTSKLESNESIFNSLSNDTGLSKETLLSYHVGLADYTSPESKLAAANGELVEETQCITYPQTTLTYGENEAFAVETTRIKACRVDDVQQPVTFDPIAPISTGLFGYHVAPAEADTVIITRNELDAMSVYQATGIPGVSLPTSVYQLPQSVLPLLERFSKVYLWLDDDVDGQLAAETFAHKLGESRCLIVNTRMGDARGPLNAHEALLQQKDFKEILSKASILKHDQIIDFHELRDEVYREFLSPDQAKGVQSTDLPALNAVLKGHRPGELTILTGPTGVGKTTIISQLSLDYCKSGVTTLWGSFEILNKRLAKKMLCQFAEKDLSQNPLEFDVWADKFEQLPLYFLKFFGSTSIKDVLQACQHAVYAYDVRHIILDNLQFMLSQQGRSSLDKWELQDEAVAELRRFATSKDVHITLVVHPRKENAPALDINSVFGSAKVTQEADNVVIIQKNSQGEDLRFLDIKKNRFDGTLGSIPYKFERSTMKIRGYTEQEMNDLRRRTQNVQRRSYDYDDNNYNLAANMVQDTF